MNEKSIAVVSLSDYQALYIDDKKVHEGHVIYASDLARCLGLEMQHIDLTGSVQGDYLTLVGESMPDLLSEVRNER